MGDIYENIRHVAMDLMKVLDGEHVQGTSLVAAVKGKNGVQGASLVAVAKGKYGVQGASLVAAAKGKYGVQKLVVQQEKLYDLAYLPFCGTCFYTHYGSQENLPSDSSYLLVQAQGQRQANRL